MASIVLGCVALIGVVAILVYMALSKKVLASQTPNNPSDAPQGA